MHLVSDFFDTLCAQDGQVKTPPDLVAGSGYDLPPGTCKSTINTAGEVEFYYWPEKQKYDYCGFGWKWHLAGPRDLRDPVNRAVAEFFMEQGIVFKIGNGNEGDAAICAYVGSWDNSLKLANDLNHYLSEQNIALPAPEPKDSKDADISIKDMQITGNIWGRFEVPKILTYAERIPTLGSNIMEIKGIWRRYGLNGISDLGIAPHQKQWVGIGMVPDHADSFQSTFNILASHAALKTVFGEFYHGKDTRAFYCHLVTTLGAGFAKSGNEEVIRLPDAKIIKPVDPAQYGQSFLERRLADSDTKKTVNTALLKNFGYVLDAKGKHVNMLKPT